MKKLISLLLVLALLTGMLPFSALAATDHFTLSEGRLARIRSKAGMNTSTYHKGMKFSSGMTAYQMYCWTADFQANEVADLINKSNAMIMELENTPDPEIAERAGIIREMIDYIQQQMNYYTFTLQNEVQSVSGCESVIADPEASEQDKTQAYRRLADAEKTLNQIMTELMEIQPGIVQSTQDLSSQLLKMHDKHAQKRKAEGKNTTLELTKSAAALAEFVILDANQIGLSILDESTMKPIKGAKVTIGDSKIKRTVTSDANGLALFDAGCFALDAGGSMFGSLYVEASGYRIIEGDGIDFHGGEAWNLHLKKDDGHSYLRRVNFRGLDILHQEEKIIYSSQNDAVQAFTASIQLRPNSSGTFTLRYTDAKTGIEKTMEKKFSGGSSLTSLNLSDTWCSKFQPGSEVMMSLDSTAPGKAAEHTEYATMIVVEKGVVDKPVRSMKPPVGLPGTSISFTIPLGLPVVGDLNITMRIPYEMFSKVPVSISLLPNGGFSLGVGMSASKKYNDAANEGWKTDNSVATRKANESYLKQLTSLKKQAEKGIRERGERANPMDALKKKAQAMVSLSMTGTLKRNENATSWERTYDGNMNLFVMGGMNFTLSLNEPFMAGPIPVFVGFDLTFGLSLGVDMNFTFTTGSSSAIDFAQWRNMAFDKESMDIMISPSITVALYAGVGVRKLAAIYLKGTFGLTITVHIRPMNSVNKLRTITEFSAKLSLVAEFLFFSYSVDIVSKEWRHDTGGDETRNASAQSLTAAAPRIRYPSSVISEMKDNEVEDPTQQSFYYLLANNDVLVVESGWINTAVSLMLQFEAKPEYEKYRQYYFDSHDWPYGLHTILQARHPNAKEQKYAYHQWPVIVGACLRSPGKYGRMPTDTYAVAGIPAVSEAADYNRGSRICTFVLLARHSEDVNGKPGKLYGEVDYISTEKQGKNDEMDLPMISGSRAEILTLPDDMDPDTANIRGFRDPVNGCDEKFVVWWLNKDHTRLDLQLLTVRTANGSCDWVDRSKVISVELKYPNDLEQLTITPSNGKVVEIAMLYNETKAHKDLFRIVRLDTASNNRGADEIYDTEGLDIDSFFHYAEVRSGDESFLDNYLLSSQKDEAGRYTMLLRSLALKKGKVTRNETVDLGIDTSPAWFQMINRNGNQVLYYMERSQTGAKEDAMKYYIKAIYLTLDSNGDLYATHPLHMSELPYDASEYLYEDGIGHIIIYGQKDTSLQGMMVGKKLKYTHVYRTFTVPETPQAQLIGAAVENPIVKPGDNLNLLLNVMNNGNIPLNGLTLQVYCTNLNTRKSEVIQYLRIDCANPLESEVTQETADGVRTVQGPVAVSQYDYDLDNEMDTWDRVENGTARPMVTNLLMPDETHSYRATLRVPDKYNPANYSLSFYVHSYRFNALKASDGTLDATAAWVYSLRQPYSDEQSNTRAAAQPEIVTITAQLPEPDLSVREATGEGVLVPVTYTIGDPDGRVRAASAGEGELKGYADVVYQSGMTIEMDGSDLSASAKFELLNGEKVAHIVAHNDSVSDITDIVLTADVDGQETWTEELKNVTLNYRNTVSLDVPLSKLTNGVKGQTLHIRVNGKGNDLTPDNNLVTLQLNQAFRIVRQPADQSVCLGQDAKFIVSCAGGEKPYTYQWQVSAGRNGPWANLKGANERTLTVSDVRKDQNGFFYRVIVADGEGTKLTSSAAMLLITNIPPTGDSFHLWTWLALLSASLLLGCSMFLWEKRRKAGK